jgi:hypothetical protein
MLHWYYTKLKLNQKKYSKFHTPRLWNLFETENSEVTNYAPCKLFYQTGKKKKKKKNHAYLMSRSRRWGACASRPGTWWGAHVGDGKWQSPPRCRPLYSAHGYRPTRQVLSGVGGLYRASPKYTKENVWRTGGGMSLSQSKLLLVDPQSQSGWLDSFTAGSGSYCKDECMDFPCPSCMPLNQLYIYHSCWSLNNEQNFMTHIMVLANYHTT